MTIERNDAVQAVRASLVRRASPRMQMLCLVLATGGAGFVASYGLLHAGIRSMTLRYPLAVGAGYAVFLVLVRIWLNRYRLNATVRRERDRNQLDLDVSTLPVDQVFSSSPALEHVSEFGGGGGFSGGGGGSDWVEGAPSIDGVAALGSAAGGGTSGGGEWDVDLDEGAFWLLPVAIIAALALGVVAYILYLAPTLFAELLLDAGLATGLYRRLLRAERRSWLVTAMRSTALPVCLVAAMLGLAGTIMQGVYPDAASVGAVVRHLRASPAEETNQ